MKASTGVYYPRLDHVRALAAFLVFFWHVTQMGSMQQFVPSFFPLSLFDEGWGGVEAFMTLSGYLFAKIVDGRDVRYTAFLWNRFIRLAPLLAVVSAYYFYFQGYTWTLFLQGFYWNTWPSTAWSISVEMYFYLIFPALLFVQRKTGPALLLAFLAMSIGARAYFWYVDGQVQELAYWTIVGHFDQFLLGMVFYRVSRTDLFARFGTWLFLVSLIGLMVFWDHLDRLGGFYHLGGVYPSPSPLWIALPTIEGLFWGSIIASYDNAKFKIPALIDKTLAKIGTVSYSIYLVHKPVLVFFVSKVIVFPADFPLGALLAVALFVPIVLICIVTFEIFERPFLRFRMKYVRQTLSSQLPKELRPVGEIASD